MRILLDHCVPKSIAPLLRSHFVESAKAAGLDAIRNGALLRAAAERFDLLLTTDQNLEFQQNLAALPIRVVMMVSVDCRLPTIRRCVPTILSKIETLAAYSLARVYTDGRFEVVWPRSLLAP